jgi:hypothetical protein
LLLDRSIALGRSHQDFSGMNPSLPALVALWHRADEPAGIRQRLKFRAIAP